MSEFSDRPFVAGSLVGLRAFNLDPYGRLVGPAYGQVFTPFHNQAECRKRESSFGGLVFTVDPSKYGVVAEGAIEGVKVPREKHTVAGLNCGCGFYAYFDGDNDYTSRGGAPVAAVIEGFGVCTVGERGFRAGQARLLGLSMFKSRLSVVKRDRLLRNYADIPFYETEEEMLTAHPLTSEELPSLEDPDFWTRDPR